jgi:hypothetical protein
VAGKAGAVIPAWLSGHFWEYSADRETWTALQPTPRARTSLSGLTPGKVYYFRFHVLMQDGSMGDPSQIVSLMVV